MKLFCIRSHDWEHFTEGVYYEVVNKPNPVELSDGRRYYYAISNEGEEIFLPLDGGIWHFEGPEYHRQEQLNKILE